MINSYLLGSETILQALGSILLFITVMCQGCIYSNKYGDRLLVYTDTSQSVWQPEILYYYTLTLQLFSQ